jgi:hypothetical protein
MPFSTLSMKYKYVNIHTQHIKVHMSVTEMNVSGLKDRRGYRVNDIMGLENVGPVLAPNK